MPDNVRRFLFSNHSRGLRTFLAHAFLELYGLALDKSLETLSLNFREMNKQIFAALGLNETITLAFVKPFYCSYCHNYTLLQLCGNAIPEYLDKAVPIFELGWMVQGLLENHFEEKPNLTWFAIPNGLTGLL